jgi:hypothetical protein
MKVQFKKQSNKDVVESIIKTMSGRSLGDIVSIEETTSGLSVKISKLGTSTLQFDRVEQGDLAIFTLSSEKIAFAHKAFKDDFKSKLISVIEKSGGTFLEK